ncbi:MAG TPA: carboxypeptidase-like regulatory domain-containing protein [Candidatus Angelobacter sp.]
MTRKFGCLLVVLLAWAPLHAASVGVIAGYVKDSSGTPQMGAVVEVFVSAVKVGTTVFTDSRGYYLANNLPAGTYQVKVTATSFLPSLRENVLLRSGAHVIINLTVNTLADALKLMPIRRSEADDPDDWHWTLRSAANRPILRVLEKDKDSSDSGSLVVVSHNKSERGGNQLPVKASVAFIAGAEAGGFGSAGDVTTAFALEKSLFSSGTLSFDGNIGASSGDPTGVLRASYAHNIGDSSRPTFTVTYRHFAAPGAAVQNSPYAAIEMSSSDSTTIAGFIDLNYGADLNSLEFANRVIALRPHGSIDVHLSPNMVVEYRYTTSEPDTRASKGFDSAPADLSESGPRMALLHGQPQVEKAAHHEVSVSRRMGQTSVQLAAFYDHVQNAVLTGAGDPSSYSNDVLPDVYSGTFSYGYSPGVSSTGARVVVERKIINDDLTATVDYSTGQAIVADSAADWQALAQAMSTSRQHSIGTKIYGHIPSTGTRWIASYKWTSGSTLSAVDAFNASPGQTDPYLSLFIRQPIPGTSFIPAKMDALIDLRNLLAQGYVPVIGQDGRTVYMVQSARSLRAGLAFTF